MGFPSLKKKKAERAEAQPPSIRSLSRRLRYSPRRRGGAEGSAEFRRESELDGSLRRFMRFSYLCAERAESAEAQPPSIRSLSRRLRYSPRRRGGAEGSAE